MASFSLIFKLRLLSQSFCMLACTQTPWFVQTNAMKAWQLCLSVNFHKIFVVFYSYADSVAVRSNNFLLVEWLIDAKVLLNGYAVTQNYVFVVFQSEATKKNSHDLLIKFIKETIVMKVFMQFGKNVNYMAYISDCYIEICNTHTITFGYQTHVFSQFTLESHLAWNVFDCLLWEWGPGVMMVNIATIFAPVNIAIPSSRKEALIASKVLQYTTLSKRLQHRTLSEIKTQVFTLSDVLDCVLIHCEVQKQHSNPDFLTKSIENTLPTCVDIANEYLQA